MRVQPITLLQSQVKEPLTSRSPRRDAMVDLSQGWHTRIAANRTLFRRRPQPILSLKNSILMIVYPRNSIVDKDIALQGGPVELEEVGAGVCRIADHDVSC